MGCQIHIVKIKHIHVPLIEMGTGSWLLPFSPSAQSLEHHPKIKIPSNVQTHLHVEDVDYHSTLHNAHLTQLHYKYARGHDNDIWIKMNMLSSRQILTAFDNSIRICKWLLLTNNLLQKRVAALLTQAFTFNWVINEYTPSMYKGLLHGSYGCIQRRLLQPTKPA